MNHFESQMFNSQFVNEANYRQIQAQIHAAEQNERVIKVVRAFTDMLDQVQGMDIAYQQQTCLLCLAEVAKRYGWQ